MKKILWVGVEALHDLSSAKAQYARNVLLNYSKAQQDNVEIRTLGAFVFKNKEGVNGLLPTKSINVNEFTKLVTDNSKIKYYYIKTKSIEVEQTNSADMDKIFNCYLWLIKEYKPDLILGFCSGDFACSAIFADAKKRQIPTVYLLTQDHDKAYALPFSDLLLTKTPELAQKYIDNGYQNVKSVGYFIKKDEVEIKNKAPTYITMIGASFANGFAYFAKLALMFKDSHPEVRFLLIKDCENFDELARSLKIQDPNGSYINSYTVDDFSNVDVAPRPDTLADVYALTKILIAPSLTLNTDRQAQIEALFNGIPVLASSSSVSDENFNSSEFSLKIVPQCIENPTLMPEDKDCELWYQKLNEILSNYNHYENKAKKLALSYDINQCVKQISNLLDPLLAKRASFNSQYVRTGYMCK